MPNIGEYRTRIGSICKTWYRPTVNVRYSRTVGVGVPQGSVASFVASFHTWRAAIKTPENISGLENYFIIHYAHWK